MQLALGEGEYGEPFMSEIILEICAGSAEDCILSYEGGAGAVELVCSTYLGGISPTVASLEFVKERCPGLQVIPMTRPRGAGFCYSDPEFEVMIRETKDYVGHGADGVVFGILKPDRTLDAERLKRLCDIVKSAGKKAVIHRAFDCVDDQNFAIETLIDLGVDRVLTSGGALNAFDGRERLAELNRDYGNRIEIMPGSGVNLENAKAIIEVTGVKRIHSACSGWKEDVTTSNGRVSYGFDKTHPMGYDCTLLENVKAMVNLINS